MFTVRELYDLIDKSKEYWDIWIYSMDGMTQYGYVNSVYKFENIPEHVKDAEIKKLIPVGSGVFVHVDLSDEIEKKKEKCNDERIQTLEISKCLTLSTAHITEVTSAQLESEAKTNKLGISVYLKEGYGFWIFCPDDLVLQYESGLYIPEDLWACMSLAYENGCNWLCLDCDGLQTDKLPVYEWKSSSDKKVEQLWDELDDVLIEEDEEGRMILANDWGEFSKGTERKEVWDWFDKHHSKGFVWLMNEYEKDSILSNVKVQFPDAASLKPGEWSEFGQEFAYANGHYIEVGLYREPIDDSEYAGHLTLHVFNGDEVLGCYDVEE